MFMQYMAIGQNFKGTIRKLRGIYWEMEPTFSKMFEVKS
jgi:hypothetical protein